VTFIERLKAARQAGDITALIAAIPFSSWLGIGIERVGDELLGHMRFADHVVGNPTLPAIHGGAIATLLESTAIAIVLWEEEPDVLPRPVTLTFDYLRRGKPEDVWAAATIVRRGRRVCTVRVLAWQEDRDKPIAAANATLLLA
jgi:uncharacterized protein (TIGR00369 family)